MLNLLVNVQFFEWWFIYTYDKSHEPFRLTT